jgi:hypothetical protein
VLKKYPKFYIYFFIMGIILATSAALIKTRLNPPIPRLAEINASPSDAAFRDGLYLGKLDANSGKPQHVSLGRWSTAKDRASFTAGYQQSYKNEQAVARETPAP